MRSVVRYSQYLVYDQIHEKKKKHSLQPQIHFMFHANSQTMVNMVNIILSVLSDQNSKTKDIYLNKLKNYRFYTDKM